MYELASLRELELASIIRKLDEKIARYKLGHDNHQKQIESLERELLDRDECIYKLHKQSFLLQEERKTYHKMNNDLTIYTMKETIDLQQKEIESLKTKLKRVQEALSFQDNQLRKTA